MKSNEAVILKIDNAVTWAEAKTELNATMLKLRTQYGFAPAKGISLEEMDQRCKNLVEATGAAVKKYAIATGKAPDRMPNTSPYKTSKDFSAKKYEGLQAFANVPDERLKRAPLHTAEAMGNLLNYNADYLLKAKHEAAVRARTRKEWQKAEYEYVEKSAYNLRDLYDDLMERMDATENYINPEEYRAERCKWRQCGYYACDNYFPTAEDHMRSHAFNQSGLKVRRKDSKYCCADCRKDQENALARLKKTGTLLPEYAYEYILDDARETRAEKEVATTSERMSKIADLP
ncbi:hypothetical protein QF028_003517 [Neobacillus sp. B4I6]|uniref:hypothetical protein n=1 Tax=Neobacillus sp. B4I6 TaxID=3373925 RepID=UPI003D1E1F8A